MTARALRRIAPRRGLAAAGASCLLALALAGCGAEPPAPTPTYVGRQACAACHPAEDSLWQGSHHAAAMAVADSTTVLGNFDNATYTYGGVTSRFSTREGRYYVTTDGPDGRLTEYPVAYTFGVYPLQQYLIAFPKGRYQALGIAWDTRTTAEGGQRWYHLYPGERVDHADVLHWTGLLQNWNFMCAQCHSTNLQKGYVVAADSYATTWSEIDVSCEACHGPGSRHVELAQGRGAGSWSGASGLTVSFRDTTAATWTIDSTTGIAKRSAPRGNRMEVETCGLCHARRAQVWPDSAAGRILAQTQRVATLEEGLYYPDGQQQDEVYEYGSFLQSRMYRAGVTCGDCHEPHRSTTRLAGNALCARCHLATRYDAASHTHHADGSAGAQCVACHMPTRNYMVVDARRDHGMKIPRPDLSVAIGTPNACTACHADKPVTWAAEAAAGWYGPPDATTALPALALAAGRAGAPGAGQALVGLSRDTAQPGIVRAAAVTLLPANPSPYGLSALQMALAERDPLLRRAAADQLEVVGVEMRVPMALPLLHDSVRTVRLAAFTAVAGFPDSAWTEEDRAAYARALDEYRASQLFNADRPESWVNLGALEVRLRRPQEAEAAYRRALAMQPQFVAAYAQLAELYRVAGRDAAADSVLRAGLARVPANVDLEYQLGLALVRQQKRGEALPWLKAAASSGLPHYVYVYGVALYEAGDGNAAIAAFEGGLRTAPDDQELLYGLASIAAATGRRNTALVAARRLAALNPGNAEIAKLVSDLEGTGTP